MSSISLSDYDLYLFHEGTNYQSYRLLGAHFVEHQGTRGVRFAVWAPNAQEVRVLGDFNGWQGYNHTMHRVNTSGIWAIFIPALLAEELYKFEILTTQGQELLKADPYAFYAEMRPNTASKIYCLDDYDWQDSDWQRGKKASADPDKPMLIYEVHLGSWKKRSDGSFLSYKELTEELIDYVVEMGYTHIELLPIAEHPLDGSWGYQVTGFFAATSRYGTPNDLMHFIDVCHQKGIGVILDWVPAHFCKDAHGLRIFDNSNLYEYQDPEKAEKNEWGTLGFDLGKPEVQSFLISNALFWMDLYHIDGLRVDAVTSMLYLNYGKKEDAWTPNIYGGSDNLEAIDFLKKLNATVFKYYPNAVMIAEESTAWPLVTAPVNAGGLGFSHKWNMGWMNDVLKYMEMEPIYRKYHHGLLTFSFFYAFSENFILALSHDEVVHGKKSLLNKMPGDYWQKFANLRLFYGYMMAHPGKKLLFMGGEFGQFDEWQFEHELGWNLLEYESHKKMQHYVRCLNKFYHSNNALWQLDHSWEGFEWVDANNRSQSILIFTRKSLVESELLIILCNFTPVTYKAYKVGVPKLGVYREVFNSDYEEYGGSGQRNDQKIQAQKEQLHSQPYCVEIVVPPLAFIVLKLDTDPKTEE